VKQLLFSALTILFLLASPSSIYAHAGGGPPFLKINDKYAYSNPFYIIQPSFIIPMDAISDNFVVGQQINFKIDTAFLGVPEEILKQSTFRWQFEENGPFIEGLEHKYTYNKTGSYLVTIEAKGPGDSSYIVLDSLQINVIPSQLYQAPSVFIKSDSETSTLGKPIKFYADIKTDPSTSIKSYQWDFGDKKLRSGKEETATFSENDIYQPVFLKITDTNNLTSHTAIAVSSKDNKITLIPYVRQNITPNGPTSNPQETKKPNAQTIQIKPKDTTFSLILFVIVISIVAIIILKLGQYIWKKYGT
jgi:hypothetical protein